MAVHSRSFRFIWQQQESFRFIQLHQKVHNFNLVEAFQEFAQVLVLLGNMCCRKLGLMEFAGGLSFILKGFHQMVFACFGVYAVDLFGYLFVFANVFLSCFEVKCHHLCIKASGMCLFILDFNLSLFIIKSN